MSPSLPTRGGGITAFDDRSALAFKDNTQYLERVDLIGLQKQFVLPTTTIVLSTDPPLGTQVPVGTQVNLTLVTKGDLPTTSLGATPVVVKKWPRAGDVLLAVESAGGAIKGVLEKGLDYSQLSAGDRAVVDGFIRQQLGEVSQADLPNVYADIGFMYGL